MTLINLQRHVVPTAILTKSKLVPITTARPVTAVVPKPHVTRPRQAKTVVTKPHSQPKRHINHRPSPKPSNFPPKVTAVKVSQLSMDDMLPLVEIQREMCDKKNSVLFTDTECVILFLEFKLPDENQWKSTGVFPDLIEHFKKSHQKNEEWVKEIYEMRYSGEAEMDQDDDVVLKDDREEDREAADAIKDAKIYKIDMDHANKVLSMQEDKTEPAKVQEVVDVVITAKLITEVVTAASETVAAASAIVTVAEAQVPAAILTAAPTRIA
nr:hypothetical protein [Tanacetum cinerariifolium]